MVPPGGAAGDGGEEEERHESHPNTAGAANPTAGRAPIGDEPNAETGRRYRAIEPHHKNGQDAGVEMTSEDRAQAC